MKTIIGIDWSEKKHCVHAYNESGAKLLRLEVAATVTGFRKLTRQVNKLNPEPANCLVAIETAHNLLVDYLHDLGYTLCILAPSLVSSNRGRQGSSRAKDDDRDAPLLAEILRTDLGRLIPWQPDGPLVRQMRILLTAVDQLTKSIVRQRNRLRALLLRFYPQALDAFGSLKTQFSLRFLTAFPGPALCLAPVLCWLPSCWLCLATIGNVIPRALGCPPSPAPRLLPSPAARVATSNSAELVTTITAIPPSNLPIAPFANRLGLLHTSTRHVTRASPKATPIAAWPIAGCTLSGRCGNAVKRTTKPTTSVRSVSIAERQVKL
jgi:hypothetical protein